MKAAQLDIFGATPVRIVVPALHPRETKRGTRWACSACDWAQAADPGRYVDCPCCGPRLAGQWVCQRCSGDEQAESGACARCVRAPRMAALIRGEP